MKIITLNTWGGRAGKEKLLSFLAEHKDTIDIFCFQEIWSAPYEHLDGHDAGGKKINNEETMVYGMQEISKLLSNHRSYFHPHHLENYGLMMLVDKEVVVQEKGEVFVHKHKGYVPTGDVGRHARNIQYVKTIFNGLPMTIINFHGLWNGMGKGDSDERLEQSKNILNFLKTIEGEVILCGDFNLLPETESLKMFEDFGLRNLIKEYNMTSTRTSYYQKPDKFADYIFVTKGLNVKDFKVLPDEVSDHSPLLVEIE
jgi:endonuclease/exonuclease/phosphatase family metal-dependent hydrolase